MKRLFIIVPLILFSAISLSDEEYFINDWKNSLIYEELEKSSKYKNHEIVTTQFNKQAIKRNELINDEGKKPYLIYKVTFIKNYWLQLYIPYASEKFYENYEKCVRNRGYIKYKNIYTKIPINPLCSETSTLDDLEITLHYLNKGEFPYMSITTNGPACVPSWLYKYNEKSNKFKLEAKKCGG